MTDFRLVDKKGLKRSMAFPTRTSISRDSKRPGSSLAGYNSRTMRTLQRYCVVSAFLSIGHQYTTAYGRYHRRSAQPGTKQKCQRYWSKKMVDNNLFLAGKPLHQPEMDRLMEQYKLAVEMWDRVRARRQQANAFYLSINTALMGVATIQDNPKLPLHYLCVLGMIICTLWSASILNYRFLANDKYDIIARLEQFLPSAPLSAESTTTDGTSRSMRRPFTWVKHRHSVCLWFTVRDPALQIALGSVVVHHIISARLAANSVVC